MLIINEPFAVKRVTADRILKKYSDPIAPIGDSSIKSKKNEDGKRNCRSSSRHNIKKARRNAYDEYSEVWEDICDQEARGVMLLVYLLAQCITVAVLNASALATTATTRNEPPSGRYCCFSYIFV